ncbi:hypothetical protein ABIC83_002563 [Roseateles asaccharophilus]|uniref:hypothetical protein n=1 Tax=Roseateles asaccharophilus TaxID=582607 RepID=UPI0038372A3B
MGLQSINNAALIVIAKVRRILLELGEEVDIETIADSHYGMGPIERWIHQPLQDLGNETPIQILQKEGGEEQLRKVIALTLMRAAQAPRAEGE